jgi:membrane protease YdiL (CAAX protease family)
MRAFLLGLWETWLGEPLRRVEADSLAYRLSDAGRGIDWKTPVVLITAAACLTIQQYTSSPAQVVGIAKFFANTFSGAEAATSAENTLRRWNHDPLGGRLWWATVSVLTYVFLPVLVLKFVFRAKLGDYGLKIKGVLRAWPLYVLFVMVMTPLVWFFSMEDRFQQTYPFVRFSDPDDVRANLWKWELAYAAQFVALEFFFRGFVVHGTKHRFGVYAVFVSTVPYVLIHFGKPVTEATASIIAGVVLGYMSLATRSVWLGAALHIGVAWGMDCACLARRGLL